MRQKIYPLLALGCLSATTLAEDWPTYRRDPSRGAVTSEKLELPLKNIWYFRSRQARLAPRHLPLRPESTKKFGSSHQEVLPEHARFSLPIIAVGDSVYFTSHDGRAVCLEAKTGQKRWEFLTGAAITCAPNYAAGKIYIGSDDAHVYCLDARTGEQVWKHKPVTDDRWFISFGRMSSIWPVRTDVLVDEGSAYFGAGVFPHDGMYVNAIHARSGKREWRSVCSGYGFAGHLFASKTSLVLPTELKGFHRHQVKFRRSDGSLSSEQDPEIDARREYLNENDGGVVIGGIHYTSRNDSVMAWKKDDGKADGGRKQIWGQRVVGMLFDSRDTLYAGGVVYYAANEHRDRGQGQPAEGKDGAVFALDARDGKNLWEVRIPERTHQMAVAGGRLFVSTRQGTIYCFGSPGEEGGGVVDESVEPDPFTQVQDKDIQACRHAAQRILAANDPGEQGLGLEKEGFALVLDCDSGALAFSLAKSSNLYICAVFDDPDKAQTARRRFSRANLLASRISVWFREPGTRLPYSPNFADLIVSERAAVGGVMPDYTVELEHLLKPIRGIALLGGKQEDKVISQWVATARTGEWKTIIQHEMRWAVHVRPPVDNGGGWTHANGNPGNTMCSHDSALKPPLGIVWYGPPYSKHSLGRPPLVHNGVLVCPIDENTVEGYDAYNGRKLWHYNGRKLWHYNKVLALGGRSTDRNSRMMAVGGNSLFIPDGNVEPGKKNQGVLRLDLWTGKVIGGYPAPFPEMRMGHFALSRDGKTFWRSGYGDKTETQGDWTCLYAVDTESGKVLWMAGGPGKEKPFGLYSERVPYERWAAMGDGLIYIKRAGPSAEQVAQLDAETKAYLAQNDPESLKNFDQLRRQIKRFVAMDAMTGKILYDRAVDVQDCDTYVAAHNGKVLFLNNSGEKWWGGFGANAFKDNSIAVHDALTGKFLWKRKCNYRFEPVITDNTIYAEPWAFDLATGKRQRREHPITGAKGDFTWVRHDKQCGGYSGSTHFLFGRNKGFGYHDVLRDHGMYQTWHHRQACDPDTSSGGGMMLKPPFNIGCGCPWSLPYTIAMTNVSIEPAIPFRFFQSGSSLPVKELRINFGASGDRRDKAGKLWFNPVRDGHPSKLHLTLAPIMTFHPTGEQSPGYSTRYGRRSASDIETENTPAPFLFDSYAYGLKKFIVPVTVPGERNGIYTVRLGFSALADDQPGQRVFDVQINGKTVQKDLDVVKQTGRANRALWKEFTVALSENLELDLVTKPGNSAEIKVPLINAMEIIRKEVVALGFKMPASAWVNEKTPERAVEIEVANHRDVPFSGKLHLNAPSGIMATPSGPVPVALQPGERRNIEVLVKNNEPARKGSHSLAVKLLSDTGKLEHEHTLAVDCLGKLQRRSLTGTGRWCMTRKTYETWINRSVPPHYVGRFPASLGSIKAGDDGAACSWMRFGIPREIGKIHSMRMRLHAAPELSACWHSLYGSDSEAPRPEPGGNHWGALRLLNSLAQVEINPLNYPELPGMLPEHYALAPSGLDPNVVEAVLPTDVQRNENGEGLVQLILEATAMNGPVYWASQGSRVRPENAPLLVIDYEPAVPANE